MKLLLILLATVLSTVAPAHAQSDRRLAAGDTLVRNRINSQARYIYTNVKTWRYLLSRANPLGFDGAEVTEIGGGFIDETPRRVLVAVWTGQGKYSAEFYVSGDTLLHTYETFEYYEDAAPPSAWRNFKGLPAWERLAYFDGGLVRYSEEIGTAVAMHGENGRQLQERARRLLELLPRTKPSTRN